MELADYQVSSISTLPIACVNLLIALDLDQSPLQTILFTLIKTVGDKVLVNPIGVVLRCQEPPKVEAQERRQ